MSLCDRARQTAVKYRGGIAGGYEARRVGQPKWEAEQAAVECMLAEFPARTKVLDIPVGTGRFLPLYAARDFDVTGIDISRDMLSQARRKDGAHCAELALGDIFAIGLADKAVDVTLSIRIMNLIGADMGRALAELQRVTRRAIIFNLRVWTPGTKHRHPQKMEDVHAALAPGWSVAEDVALHEADFRLIRLACAG